VAKVDRRRRSLERRERYIHWFWRRPWVFVGLWALVAGFGLVRGRWVGAMLAIGLGLAVTLIARTARFRTRVEGSFARRRAELNDSDGGIA
jgi:hypothetical protein